MSDYKTRARNISNAFSKKGKDDSASIMERVTMKEAEETEEQKKKRKRKEQAARAIQQYGSSDEE